jgi:hypothetical protein
MHTPAGAASEVRAREAYRSTSKSLHHLLELADAAAEAGDLRDAIESIVGGLEDLAPQLTTLARFLRNAL